MKAKFGFVALLDALGARNATTRESQEYLKEVSNIPLEISSTLDLTMPAAPEPIKDTLKRLNPRFFGDTILLTYSVSDENHFNEYLDRIAFVLASIIVRAMSRGILFRGAISIGEYLESQDVVLGPAVVDAANWYEKIDMIGVMTTPQATHYMKSAFYRDGLVEHYRDAGFLHEYTVPNKVRPGLVTYVVNWPDMIDPFIREGKKDKMRWYYETIKRLRVPIGTEEKYINTEAYLRHVIATTTAKE